MLASVQQQVAQVSDINDFRVLLAVMLPLAHGLSTKATATAYNLLHRHGWRKLAPDKRNVAADVQAQEEWKKNCPNVLPESKKNGKGQVRLG
jgi:hypothetical protein